MLPRRNRQTVDRPPYGWWRFIVGAITGIAVSIPITFGIEDIPVRAVIAGLWGLLFGYMFARPDSRPVDRRKYIFLLAAGLVVFGAALAAYLVQ